MREGILNAGFSSYLFLSPAYAVGTQLEEFNHVNAVHHSPIGAGDQGRQLVH